MLKKDWWKSAVIYQIYPRSFQDTNGDGFGDFQGIIKRLPYLEKLGIDCIWLCPVYRSPQDDNGYDISDYCDVDPMFGTMADMEELIGKAREHGIYIVMDLVLNHSSDEHKWFIEAKKSRENPYHDYYVWRDGKEGVLPNDMKAAFGGSAWEWVPEVEQYYFHQFSVKQPDLNWENPKLRQELWDIINFWIDKGVGGFRLDVIDLVGKVPDEKITSNGPKLHEYIKEMTAHTFVRDNLISVGETWSATPEIAKLYSNPDGSELSMVFQFEHICLDQQEGKEKWDLAPLPFHKFKEVWNKWQTELYGCGWNSLFWDNHDLPRIVSRWGDEGQYREESAKMLATLLHGMQGTPYIYQGEELGMTNVKYELEEYRDIELFGMYKERRAQGYTHEELMESIYAKTRDNARTPMQWDTTEQAGFTTGKPWMKVNPNYTEINAAEQVDCEDSIFNYYRKLIQLRKELPVLTDGKFTMLDMDHDQIFAYLRDNGEDKLLVVCNFYGNTVDYAVSEKAEDLELLIGNYTEENMQTDVLRPYEARIYRIR
ncbi:MAG: alpha-glucosidase [Blautia sp.]|uniref:Alpha,alpha-phosphotrehalase n=2 Tax=Bacillota TaxID=1239 RepID=A0A844GJV8_9FIRM|nr:MULTISPECIES: alpha-glucosidase [Blautia]MCI6304698.1 alpha-glucosidase [Blautia sp.]MTD60951.1 alpha,alpha-phosphotrehalase [Blautia luti DSM 14534 = JCM 17040]RHQ91255.1 alpha-glucosidase [Ruminococcus sp. AF21-42]BEI62256.1 alpha-glucosidase [Blautia luti]